MSSEGKLKARLLPIAQMAHDEDVVSSEEAERRANLDIDSILDEAKKEFPPQGFGLRTDAYHIWFKKWFGRADK